MARKITTTLIDDVSGEPADDTVTFGLDGVTYEIDLASHRAHSLRDTLSDYVAKGRKRGKFGAPATRGRTARPVRIDRQQSAAVREWARRNGWSNLGAKGRIPISAQTAFDEAHSAGSNTDIRQPAFSG